MARKQKNFKKLVRERMKKTGESYQAARRQLEAHFGEGGRGEEQGHRHPDHRFAIHRLLAAGKSSPNPEIVERRRRRMQLLERRLTAAVTKLYSRQSVERRVSEFKEKYQGEGLEALVLALEQMILVQPMIEVHIEQALRFQPLVDAAAKQVESFTEAALRSNALADSVARQIQDAALAVSIPAAATIADIDFSALSRAETALHRSSAVADSVTRQIQEAQGVSSSAVAAIRDLELKVPTLADAAVLRSCAVDDSAARQIQEMAQAVSRSAAATFQLPKAPDLAGILAVSGAGDHATTRLFDSLQFIDPLRNLSAGNFVAPTMIDVAVLTAHSRAQVEALQNSVILCALPVLDSLNLSRSLLGLEVLREIGEALTSNEHPYSDSVTDLLRLHLGDLTQGFTAAPPEWFDSPQTRYDFLGARGFNFDTTAFPGSAYGALLRSSFAPRHEKPRSLRAQGQRRSVVGLEPGYDSSRAFRLLFELEHALRTVISHLLEQAFGPKWVNTQVPAPVRKAWEEKRLVAISDGEPSRELIHFSELGELKDIVVRKDNWSSVFQVIFIHRDSVQESLRRVIVIRRPVAHHRPLTNEDYLELCVEYQRLMRALTPVLAGLQK